MDVHRLRSVLDLVISEHARLGVDHKLAQVLQALSVCVSSPSSGSDEQFRVALTDMLTALRRTRTNDFVESSRRILVEIHGERLTGNGLAERVLDVANQRPFLPARARETMVEIADDLQRGLGACAAAKASLEHMNVGPVHLEPDEYEPLRDAIRERLLDARCRWPDGTERAIYTEVHKPEELYGRSRHDDETLPDLMLVPSPGLAVVRKIRGSALVRWSSLRRREGTHRIEGILVAHGPGVQRGQRLNAEIADIAPTILAALGQPVPKDMDGRALVDLFDPPLSVQYEPPVKHSFERTEDTVYTEEEQEALTRRLADLGYL